MLNFRTIVHRFIASMYQKNKFVISAVGKERANLSAIVLLVTVIMWFLFREVSSSSWCLGWAALSYCGTPGPSFIIL